LINAVEDSKEDLTAFIMATQIKIDESDSQSLTKVLYQQKPLQMSFIFMFRL